MSGCPVCGSERSSLALRDVRDYVTGEAFSIVRCEACTFAWTAPVPPSLDPYYPPRYRGFNPLAAALLRWSYRRRVASWLERLPRVGRALEVGTGRGWMLRALRERGWTAIGTERTPDAALAAARASGATVHAVEVADLDERNFDLVVMFHVLEHVDDPVAMLRAVAARVRPGGTLVLGLPNNASWQARATGRHWMHLDTPRHLGHFSPESIEAALGTAGFDIASVDFRSYEHDALGWTQSALDALGFEKGVILKRLIGLRERRGPLAATLAAFALAVPLTVAGGVLAVLSWRARAGAVMQVWAVRRDGA